MRNLKIFGIIMMLVLGGGFVSCSDDDNDGPGSGSINEYLEGEWFQVNNEWKWQSSDGFNETSTTVWDYKDQTAYGVCSEGCTDHNPEKLYIECVGEDTYEVTGYRYYSYSSRWSENGYEIYELNGNVIYEDTEEYDGEVYYSKVYIKSISANDLVVVSENKAVYEDGVSEIDFITTTYRRNY